MLCAVATSGRDLPFSITGMLWLMVVGMFDCSSTCKTCACLVEVALELCASLKTMLWGLFCGFASGLEGMDVLLPKQKHKCYWCVSHVMNKSRKEFSAMPRTQSRKRSAKKHNGDNKESAREPPSTKNPQDEKQPRHRSNKCPRHATTLGQARRASQRQLRQRMYDSTGQDKANKLSTSTRS